MKSKLLGIFKNPYVFSVISKITLVVLGFLYTVLMSRYLGASLKGDVAYITSVTSITCIIFGCGVHQAYPYFKKKTGADVAPIFMRLAVEMLAVYLILAAALTLLLRADVSLGCILMLTPIFVYNRIVSYICMVENPNRKNLVDLIAAFLEVVFIVVLWLLVKPTLLIGAMIYLFKDIFLSCVYTWRMRNALKTHVKSRLSVMLEILKFGFFPMMMLLMSTLNYRVDVIMLKASVSSAEVGIYSVGVMLAERVWLIPDALKEVMISNLAKGKGAEEVSFVIRLCNSSCILVVAFIIALGRPFINLFFGAEYSSAYTVTIVILAGVLFMVYYKLIYAYNVVHGKQKESIVFLFISVVCNLTANALLIPRFGNIGAALASIISYAAAAFLFSMRFSRETGTRMRDMLLINRSDLVRLKLRFQNNKRGQQ